MKKTSPSLKSCFLLSDALANYFSESELNFCSHEPVPEGPKGNLYSRCPFEKSELTALHKNDLYLQLATYYLQKEVFEIDLHKV